MLWTTKEYKDFVIEFDARWKGTTPRGVDTGVEMRKPKIQLQLGVSGSLRVDMSGSFYTGGKPAYPEIGQAKDAKKLMKPEGEWNTFRIVQKGDVTTVWLNGKLVVDHAKMENFWDRTKPLPAKGPIMLQTHGGEIRWRNLFLKTL